MSTHSYSHFPIALFTIYYIFVILLLYTPLVEISLGWQWLACLNKSFYLSIYYWRTLDFANAFLSPGEKSRGELCHIARASPYALLACLGAMLQSVSKVLGQMPQNLWISRNDNPPAACSMSCPISRRVWCVLGLIKQHWLGWGGGRGTVLRGSVMIHLQAETTCVPTTSESDCLGPICHNIIVHLKSTGDRILCERSISAPFRSQKI
jgi:hypothetical protein